MPPHSKSLEDEGAMIVAFKLVRDGKFQEEEITEILQSPGKLPGVLALLQQIRQRSYSLSYSLFFLP